MDQELLCGGGFTPTSCLKYGSGGWTEYSWSLQQERHYHLSWRRPNNEGVQLIGGGWDSSSLKTTETVSSSRSQTSFHLEDRAEAACGIQHDEFFVITGGIGTWSKVRRFAEDGTMDNLPNLKTGRAGHGCGHYFSDSHEMVFLVTGGYDDTNNNLKTTEIMSPGGDWKYVGELSNPRIGLQGINVDNNLFMTGGFADETGTTFADILKFDIAKEEWVKIGEMSKARTNHALTQVPLSEVENYCQ